MQGIRRLITLRFQAAAAVYAYESALREAVGLARRPAVRKATLFCTMVLPVPFTPVKAWGPWKSEPNDHGLRIFRVEDELIKDILLADKLYETSLRDEVQNIERLLMKHEKKGEPEILWRLARIKYERSKKASSVDKKELIKEAYFLAETALSIDTENFGVHKWMAILLNEVSQMKGLKEQISQLLNIKQHMLKASELNPNDPTSLYLLGHWCFSVAEVGWVQRKVAATLFATPPTCQYEEALKFFEMAEKTKPMFYSMNLLFMAKSYIQIGQTDKAKQCLQILINFPLKSDDDFAAKEEAAKLLRSLGVKVP